MVRSAASSKLLSVALVLSVALGLRLLIGCGGASDGNGNDDGGPVTITGTVVDGADTSAGVGNAYVYVPLGSGRPRAVGDAAVLGTFTDASGAFRLDNVPAGVTDLAVLPPAGGDFAPGRWRLDVGAGDVADLLCTIVSRELSARVSTVVVEPASATLSPNGTEQFTATVLDAGGNALPVTPTWVALNRVGAIGPSGRFRAGLQLRTGRVVAVAGARSGSARVVVGPPAGPSGNSAPTIEAMDTFPGDQVRTGARVLVSAFATDADDDALAFEWSADDGDLRGSFAPDVVEWLAPGTSGSYTVSVRVSDERGGTDTASVTVEVGDGLPNRPPRIVQLLSSDTSVNSGDSVFLYCDAFDFNGDPLTYQWSANGGLVTPDDTSPELALWTAPDTSTRAEFIVSVTVSDAEGATDRASITVQHLDPSGAVVPTFTLTGGWGEADVLGDWDYQGLAAAPAGNVYVVERNRDRIIVFSEDGGYVGYFGRSGTSDGELTNPRGIVISASAEIYVSDTEAHRIQVFDAYGQFVRKFGAFGTASGLFREPRGLAFDAGGNLYVADYLNARVQVFDAADAFVRSLAVTTPQDVAVDGSGNVYVTDNTNDQVSVFDPTGGHVAWGSLGAATGRFADPYGIDVDAQGQVYVADEMNHRVQVFDSSGGFLSSFGSFGTDAGQLSNPTGLAVGPSGNLFVAEWGAARLQKFTPTGASVWVVTDPAPDRFNMPLGADTDGGGNVYVVDNGNARVLVFEADGNPMGQIGGRGGGDGQFDMPTDVAVDSAGHVYVVDKGNNRVQRFDASGTFELSFGALGSAAGAFDHPMCLALDADGNVYVTDADNNRVEEFTADGVYLASWGSPGFGDGQFSSPGGIAIDPVSGRVFVSDATDRVQVFDAYGGFLESFGVSGSGDGQFSAPAAIALGGDGYVYVVDSNNDRIEVFNDSLSYVTELTEGFVGTPWGIAIGPSGRVYATDEGGRVTAFDPVP